jgi:CheY-like chemotaxis protein
LQVKELDLNEVVASIGQMLKRLINENIVLDIQPDPQSPRLRADPNTLAQVLLNLALNARDAMPAGGRLTIRTSHEVLDKRSAQALPGARAGSWACLSVSDNGAGIASDVLPRIFEPFFTTKAVGKGTGLGLATVYGIVKQHHGFVAVDSSLGHGTTFRVFLPLPAGAEEILAPAALPQAVSGHRELVLLVEDDAAVRSTLTSILEQHNYRLIVADDGMQALELFGARGPEIDLLLTDVVLPGGLSGAELAFQLRRQNPRLRVILCSGYSADKVEQGMESLPGITFLQKPYRSEQLLTLLRSMLDKSRTTSAETSLVSLR